jgi:hypothetical protein
MLHRHAIAVALRHTVYESLSPHQQQLSLNFGPGFAIAGGRGSSLARGSCGSLVMRVGWCGGWGGGARTLALS